MLGLYQSHDSDPVDNEPPKDITDDMYCYIKVLIARPKTHAKAGLGSRLGSNETHPHGWLRLANYEKRSPAYVDRVELTLYGRDNDWTPILLAHHMRRSWNHPTVLEAPSLRSLCAWVH